ncbi:MAG TPA: biotin/lipoyl-containing protein [Actinomycetota bacterium]
MRELQVPMPKLSMTMEEGELAAWHKHEGDVVEAGEILCEVASDKAEIEVESPVDGTVVTLHAAEGDVVKVGAPIATLATEADDLVGDLLD